jgi:catechol 2,3-dioxygenase-like lactoylglutathione lyase family enzyme
MANQTASVTGLRSVEFGVANMERSLAFYEDVWQLAPLERDGDAHYFRATGPEHHVVVLRPRDVPGLIRANFAAADRAAVDGLHDRIVKAGGKPLSEPRAIDEPGGGYGFTLRDLEGRELRVLCEVATHRDAGEIHDRPYKLSHLVVNAADTDGSTAFFREALGFRLRDQTAAMDFLGCNPDHHSVAITRRGNVSLNHVAFEVPSLDALMRGSARVRRSGFGIEWGVGRHGPGNNIFAYFLDPNELAVEYTTAIEQVDDATYKPRTAKDWKPPIQGNPDYWGFAEPPSPRFEKATSGHAAMPAHA